MGRKLTPLQRAYIAERARGMTKIDSAIMAGYSGTHEVAKQVEESDAVQQELARIRAETAKNANVTKEMVAQWLIEAVELAKRLSDPGGMVAASRELGKLLGHYAPEVKKIEKAINKADMKRALEDLSDEELRAITRGRVVEGKFTVVEDGPKAPDVPKLPAN